MASEWRFHLGVAGLTGPALAIRKRLIQTSPRYKAFGKRSSFSMR